MLDDLYGLSLSTSSSAARDAYDEGVGLLLSGNVGPVAAFDRAIAADPGFALAHAARARSFQLVGDMKPAQAAIEAARSCADRRSCGDPLSEREASHLAFSELLIAGNASAALACAKKHLETWPRDAMVLNPCASVFGLIGFSGVAGREQDQLVLLDSLARHYGDDAWFLCTHAFALAEIGDRAAAREKIERGMAMAPRHAHGAHIRAHIYYEDGEQAAATGYLREWIADYPPEAILHCHLSWHLALCELEAGDLDAAWHRYAENIDPAVKWGPALNTLTDGISFLWRAELAGNPRDPARWRSLHDFAQKVFPRAGLAFADVHIALADAVTGNGDRLEVRVRQLDELARSGRAPAAPVVAALATAFIAFQAADWDGVISAIEPVAGEHERIGGSRAQRDLVEFTLLKAYANAGRLSDLQRYVGSRRMGAAPVAGLS